MQSAADKEALALFASTGDATVLSKDQAVAVVKEATGSTGDYGRTPKVAYVERVKTLGQLARDAAAKLAASQPQPRPQLQLQLQPAEQPATPAERDAGRPLPTVAQPGAQPLHSAADEGEAALKLAEALRALMPQQPAATDEEAVRRIVAEAVAEAVAGIKPLEVAIKVEARGESRTVAGHVHPVFEKVVKLAGAGLNILLVGPAGTGKTHLAGQVAEALGRPFASASCSAGMSESQLAGWLLPVEAAGRFAYVPAPFIRAYEEGHVFLLDEIDAADPNTLTFINSALANGKFSLPQRFENPTVTRHPDFVCIAAANTFGTGADAMYVGRSQLDAATLDRFYKVRMSYDEAFEQKIAPSYVVRHVHRLRKAAEAMKLRRVVGTRAIQQCVAALSAGLDWEEVKADLLVGWSADEIRKVETARADG